MHREVVAAMAADATQNVVIGNPQTSDSNPRGSSWDPTTGIATGGDSGASRQHGQSALRPTGRASSGTRHTGEQRGRRTECDTSRSACQGWPPNSACLSTKQHHTDPDDPARRRQRSDRAIAGSDWSRVLRLIHGGSTASPGTVVPAIALARTDATHLTITLAQPLQTSQRVLQPLLSVWQCHDRPRQRGNRQFRRTFAPPPGWDIVGDLGSNWRWSFPLAATTTPVTLSDAPG